MAGFLRRRQATWDRGEKKYTYASELTVSLLATVVCVATVLIFMLTIGPRTDGLRVRALIFLIAFALLCSHLRSLAYRYEKSREHAKSYFDDRAIRVGQLVTEWREGKTLEPMQTLDFHVGTMIELVEDRLVDPAALLVLAKCGDMKSQGIVSVVDRRMRCGNAGWNLTEHHSAWKLELMAWVAMSQIDYFRSCAEEERKKTLAATSASA